MKITVGDVTITIEPGDDPNQVVAMAKAIGGEQDPVKPVRATAAVEEAPSKKRVQRCAGRDDCEGLYHASENKRHGAVMCETYNYVASYKHGRSSNHVANWSGISVSAAYHRLHRLTQLGLVTQEGRVYVSTSS